MILWLGISSGYPARMLASIILPILTMTTVPAVNPEAEIRALYRKIEQSMVRQDCNTVIAMLAPDYHYVGLDGSTMNLATMASQMREMTKMMRHPRGTFTVEEVYVNDYEATVWVTMRAKAEMRNGGKWGPVEFNAKYVETVRKFGNRWLFTESIEAPMDK